MKRFELLALYLSAFAIALLGIIGMAPIIYAIPL